MPVAITACFCVLLTSDTAPLLTTSHATVHEVFALVCILCFVTGSCEHAYMLQTIHACCVCVFKLAAYACLLLLHCTLRSCSTVLILAHDGVQTTGEC